MAQNCKHGIPEYSCAICKRTTWEDKERRARALSRSETASRPAQTETTRGPRAVVSKLIVEQDYLVLHTVFGKKKAGLALLNDKTKFVHIDGLPFLWAIQAIIERAPNVKVIRVIPSNAKRLRQSHYDLCREHGVQIVTGHHRPDLAWADVDHRSPFYGLRRSFFLMLEGQQKEMFEELLAFGFWEVQAAARYFCLGGEEFITQDTIAEQFGKKSGMLEISPAIAGVIKYLDPDFETSFHAEERARGLRKRVVRFRAILQSRQEFDRLLQSFGIEQIPEKLPLARLPVYAALIKARQSMGLEWLRKKDERSFLVLVARFGLEDGKYRTLAEVRQVLGLTIVAEMIRKFEIKGLDMLDISRNELGEA